MSLAPEPAPRPLLGDAHDSPPRREVMAVATRFHECLNHLDLAIERIFEADDRIQAVGISRDARGFHYKAVQNERKIVPMGGGRRSLLPHMIMGIPVEVESVETDIETCGTVPFPLAASFVPEQQSQATLCCGLQVQNLDDDLREHAAGNLPKGMIRIGTLGCFVELPGGGTAMLSNNHVLAGENRGVNGSDEIQNPGNVSRISSEIVATLTDFVALRPSQPNATVAMGNAQLNDFDAAVAALNAGVPFVQGFLASRGLVAPSGTIAPKIGDKVFKVGRTTGLTYGTIKTVGITMGPIGYSHGPCWFRNQFDIVGDNGTMFSDRGDSGSVIVSSTGEVVGLLFAGNGVQSYASPIDDVLKAFSCKLI